MRKKKTKAQQERDKQLRRLKSIVRRAEKAGLVFDTSPIPENATTKRLSKITGADIRKQGYRFTPEGKKDYYTPFKERQRGVEKAKRTIAEKRLNPDYEEMYIAERKMAYQAKVQKKSGAVVNKAGKDLQTARALRSSLVAGGDKDYTKKVLSDWYLRLLEKDPEAVKDFAKTWGITLDENGQPKVKDFAKELYERRLKQLTEDVKLAEKLYKDATVRDNDIYEDLKSSKTAYEKAKEKYEEQDKSDEYDEGEYFQEYDPRYNTFFDRYDPAFNPNDYNYTYAFTVEKDNTFWEDVRQQFSKGIAQRVADFDYKQYHGVVFDPTTGKPVARYDPKSSSYIPFEYREGEVYGLDRDTGEVQSFVNMFSYEILDKIDAGIYTIEGDYVLDEHSQPIAQLELVRKVTDSTQRYDREGIAIIPYEPPVFKDIADYNLNDYISSFSPNMESALRDFYNEIPDDEDGIKGIGDRLQKVHYAYERVMNYKSYEELLTGYYEMAEAIKGEPLTDEEREKLEKAVNDDRVKRTRKKKKRTKKK